MQSLVLAGWLLLAVAFTASGGLHMFPLPFPQAVLFGLTLLLGVLHRRSSAMREAIRAVSIEALLLFHTSRGVVGIYFLWLCREGRLAYAFAVPAGYGDILVALVAVVLLLSPAIRRDAHAWPIRCWNLLGLIDILFVIATAARVGSEAPESMAPLTGLPLGLLATFLVPLILYTHAIIGLRGLPSVSISPHARRETTG
jgi:hypothetical protein